MDAVILAGGKGSRLDGVMPPWWKPLMPVMGLPLVCRIVDQVEMYVERTFIVVAPENALQVTQVLGNREATLIVQRTARGPGDALRLALDLSRASAALVLMGDNLIADGDIRAVVDTGRDFVVGVQRVPFEESHRFTRVISPVEFEEGPNNTADPLTGALVWCGPLILPRDHTLETLSTRLPDLQLGISELKIGTHFTELAALHGPAKLEQVAAIDIGTPEAIMEVQP